MSQSIEISCARDDSNNESGGIDTEGTSKNVEESCARLRKKKKCTSMVWLKFEKYTDADGIEWVTCNACKAKLTGSSKSGTSHLWKHLDSCVENKRLKSKDGGSVESFKFDQMLSRGDLVRMVIMHEYPFSIVQHHAFRVFVKNLQPQFKMISRTTLKSDCMKMFKNEKQKIYGILNRIQARISITADAWTSGQNSSYMCLTAHYVDEHWKLNKYILNFFKVGESHTGENLAKLLINRLSEWNIGKKLFSIVLDNHAVNDVVVRDLLNKHLSRRFLPLNGELFHVRCCAHILNLIVQDGMDSIRNVVEKIREIIKWVKASPKRLDIFQKCVLQIDGPPGSLVLDCPTRWNSTYLMIDSAIKFKDVFPCMYMVYGSCKNISLPTNDEWEHIAIIHEHLKIFYDMTEVFSGTSYPTSNLYFAMMCELFLALREWHESRHLFVVSMAHKMLEKFEKYWKITNMILSIASIFDPRQKLKSIELYFPLIYEEFEVEGKITYVKQQLNHLLEEYSIACNVQINQESQIGVSYPPTPRCSGQHDISARGLWASRMKRLEKYIEENSASQPTKSELQMYLDELVLPFQKDDLNVESDDFDILSWWKESGTKYHVLSAIARDILGIPVSIVASEAAFSTGGRVICQTRSSLNPNTVEALICTQDWLRNELKGQETVEAGDILSTIFLPEVEDDHIATEEMDNVDVDDDDDDDDHNDDGSDDIHLSRTGVDTSL